MKLSFRKALSSVLSFVLLCGTGTVQSQNIFPLPSGNVGVGTTIPNDKLSIAVPIISVGDTYPIISAQLAGSSVTVGGIYNTYEHLVSDAYGGGLAFKIYQRNVGLAEIMRLNGETGNVGIATSSPLQKLQIGSNDVVGTTIPDAISLGATYSTVSGANPKVRLFDSNDGIPVGFGVSPSQFDYIIGSGAHVFYSNPTGATPVELIRITDAGKVGIGTTTPTSRFQINGSSATENIRIQTASAGNPGDFDIYVSGTGGFQQGTVGFNTAGNTPILFNQGGSEKLRIASDGNVVASEKILIGNIDASKVGSHSLVVNGSAIFNKVVVKVYPNWPDYVFKPNYQLRSLTSLENYIKRNDCLPDLPNAKEVETGGQDVGAIQAVLLRKIEELSLYVIDLNKKIDSQGKAIKKLQKK